MRICSAHKSSRVSPHNFRKLIKCHSALRSGRFCDVGTENAVSYLLNEPTHIEFHERAFCVHFSSRLCIFIIHEFNCARGLRQPRSFYSNYTYLHAIWRLPPLPIFQWNKFEFMIWILFRRKMFSRKSRKVEASLSTEA